jgi:hypothetical protein
LAQFAIKTEICLPNIGFLRENAPTRAVVISHFVCHDCTYKTYKLLPLDVRKQLITTDMHSAEVNAAAAAATTTTTTTTTAFRSS